MGLMSPFKQTVSSVLLRQVWPPRELWEVPQAGIPWTGGERPVVEEAREPGGCFWSKSPAPASPVASEESRGNHGNQAPEPGVEWSQAHGEACGAGWTPGSLCVCQVQEEMKGYPKDQGVKWLWERGGSVRHRFRALS